MRPLMRSEACGRAIRSGRSGMAVSADSTAFKGRCGSRVFSLHLGIGARRNGCAPGCADQIYVNTRDPDNPIWDADFEEP